MFIKICALHFSITVIQRVAVESVWSLLKIEQEVVFVAKILWIY